MFVFRGISDFSQFIFELNDLKEIKVAEMQDLYNQSLTAGFTSNATGEPHQFAYEQKDQDKFLKLALMVAKGKIAFPYPVPDKNGMPVYHTAEQYELLEDDIQNHEQTLQTKLVMLTAPAPIGAVMNATTVEEVNAIVW